MIEQAPQEEPAKIKGPDMLLPSEIQAPSLEADIKNSGQGGVDAEAESVMRLLGHNNKKAFLEGWHDEDH